MTGKRIPTLTENGKALRFCSIDCRRTFAARLHREDLPRFALMEFTSETKPQWHLYNTARCEECKRIV